MPCCSRNSTTPGSSHKSGDFAFSREDGRLSWRHANGLAVRMQVAAEEGGFRFRPSVEGIPAGMLLEWFDGPQVCVSSERAIYWPYWDGCEVTDFTRRAYRPCTYRGRYDFSDCCSLYPGIAQMQFLAAYGDGAGLYFSAIDDRHTPKGVEWELVDGGTVRLSLQTFCGDLDADGAWRPKFHYALRAYGGGWMEACEIYRDWVRTLPGFGHPPKRPAWMFDSPVMKRAMQTAQMGRRDVVKDIRARSAMRSHLVELGRTDERYLGPEWILASNDLLSRMPPTASAESILNEFKRRTAGSYGERCHRQQEAPQRVSNGGWDDDLVPGVRRVHRRRREDGGLGRPDSFQEAVLGDSPQAGHQVGP